MKNEEIIVKDIDELLALVENMPKNEVIEIDLRGEDDEGGDKKDI